MLNFIASVINKIVWFFARLVVCSLVVALVFVGSQDLQIFPALVPSLMKKKVREPDKVPPGIKSTFLTTPDGKKIEMWQMLVEPQPGKVRRAALILHGNGGPVDSFLGYQKWLDSLGISSYQVEYRGHGRSTGWPTEKGINLDAETGMKFLLGREEIDPSKVIVVGISLGSGPAAYLAKRFNVGTLVLITPYTSLPEVVKDSPILKYLVPFLWYKFPTQQYLEGTSACVVMAHGRKDDVIPFSHFERLKNEFTGKGGLQTVVSEEASHNDLFGLIKPELSEKLRTCLGPDPESPPPPPPAETPAPSEPPAETPPAQ